MGIPVLGVSLTEKVVLVVADGNVKAGRRRPERGSIFNNLSAHADGEHRGRARIQGGSMLERVLGQRRLQAAFRTNPSDPSEFRRRHGPRLFETAMLGVPQREGRGRRYTYGPKIIMAYLVMAHIVMAALGVLQREGRRRRSRQGR